MSASTCVNGVIQTGVAFLEPCVVVHLWRWFVVPLGAVQITYWGAFGLGILATVFVRQNGIERDEDKATAESVGVVLGAWGVGALIHLGMPS